MIVEVRHPMNKSRLIVAQVEDIEEAQKKFGSESQITVVLDYRVASEKWREMDPIPIFWP